MNTMSVSVGYQTMRRRGTALLMVVTILALLFVIVAGFISLARVQNRSQAEFAAGDQVNSAVDRIAEMTLDDMSEALRDASGEAFGVRGAGIGSFETIPGVGATHWLGALEPVWDPRVQTGNPAPLAGVDFRAVPGDWWVLAKLLWPAVSSLEPTGPDEPVMARIYEMMFEDAEDGDARFDAFDALRFAIAPVLDADGDGIPDADLLASRRATALVNAMAGISLELPPRDAGFSMAHIPRANANTPQARFVRSTAQQILDIARYIAAVRVVSHGGMVTLDAPTPDGDRGPGGFGASDVVPVQRAFQADLFNHMLADEDWSNRIPLHQLASAQVNSLFDRLAAARGAVEMSLRRRYLLPNAVFAGTRRTPDILAELEGEIAGRWQFPYTLVNPLAAQPTRWVRRPQGPLATGGRINLSDNGVIPLPGPVPVRPLGAWARLVSEDASQADAMTRSFAPLEYDRRHLITTVSYSDELARKLDPTEPTFEQNTPNSDLGTFRGEQKYYLGEIAKAFDSNQRWQYLGDPGDPRLDEGEVVVREIARRYYDMLAPYQWGTGIFTQQDPSSSDADFMLRREQALMLAVNTVAFAARRDNVGRIDAVVYRDSGRNASDPSDDVTYIGYAPQPFFSELIVYNSARLPQPGDPDPPPELAVAVELYNPNDPFFSAFNPNDPSQNRDVFALNLSQFVLTVEGVSGDVDLSGFSPTGDGRLNGRTFMTVVIKDTSGSNSYFDSVLPAGVVPATLDLPSGESLTVKLWWQPDPASPGTRYLVDRISIEGSVGPQSWRSAARDTSPVPFFQQDLDGDSTTVDSDQDGNPAIDYPARWGVVVGRVARASGGTQPGRQTLGNARYRAPMLIDPDQDADADGVPDHRFAPPVPLIVMNAGADPTLPIFAGQAGAQGVTDRRPGSFPTPGFLLFVPRFCAVQRASAPASGQQDWTVPELLERAAQARGIPNPVPSSSATNPLTPDQYPADFGHMPIFDNRQDLKQNSAEDNYLAEAGKLPWGLLVFDYFTTLDPALDLDGDGVPDIDPLRVPGRIDINTAVWTVLAELPMLGPDPATLVLPILPPGASPHAPTPDLPAPSFWDPAVGVLTGFGGMIHDRPEPRLIAIDPTYAQPTERFFTATRGRNVPYHPVGRNPRYRLGYWLAQAACAYRDGVPYVGGDLVDGDLDGQPEPLREPYQVFADAYLRNAPLRYRPGHYGRLRGEPTDPASPKPTARGFLTVGELLNVKGFDSSRHDELAAAAVTGDPGGTVLGRGDFVKAVSLLALLDTQWLTTRSNTFTVYVSIYDRQQPQRSTRYQATVDRSDLLPRIEYVWLDPQNGVYVTDPDSTQRATLPRVPRLIQVRKREGMSFVTQLVPVRSEPRTARPSILAVRRVGYFDTRFDD